MPIHYLLLIMFIIEGHKYLPISIQGNHLIISYKLCSIQLNVVCEYGYMPLIPYWVMSLIPYWVMSLNIYSLIHAFKNNSQEQMLRTHKFSKLHINHINSVSACKHCQWYVHMYSHHTFCEHGRFSQTVTLYHNNSLGF